MKNWMKPSFTEPRKVKEKHIEFYKSRERYQAYIALISNYEWDAFKYIFTVVGRFTKYGCVIK